MSKSRGNMSPTTLQESRNLLLIGALLIKHGAHGKPHVRRLRLTADNKLVCGVENAKRQLTVKVENMLPLSTVSVVKGKTHPNFKRYGSTVPEDHCFVVCGNKKQFALQCIDDIERDQLVAAIQYLATVCARASTNLNKEAAQQTGDTTTTTAKTTTSTTTSTTSKSTTATAPPIRKLSVPNLVSPRASKYQQYREVLLKGALLIKHGAAGKPHERRFRMTTDNQLVCGEENAKGQVYVKPHNMMPLTSASAYRGKDHPNFKRSHGQNVPVEHCFVVNGGKRQFALQCHDIREREQLVMAIEYVSACLLTQKGRSSSLPMITRPQLARPSQAQTQKEQAHAHATPHVQAPPSTRSHVSMSSSDSLSDLSSSGSDLSAGSAGSRRNSSLAAAFYDKEARENREKTVPSAPSATAKAEAQAQAAIARLTGAASTSPPVQPADDREERELERKREEARLEKQMKRLEATKKEFDQAKVAAEAKLKEREDSIAAAERRLHKREASLSSLSSAIDKKPVNSDLEEKDDASSVSSFSDDKHSQSGHRPPSHSHGRSHRRSRRASAELTDKQRQDEYDAVRRRLIRCRILDASLHRVT